MQGLLHFIGLILSPILLIPVRTLLFNRLNFVLSILLVHDVHGSCLYRVLRCLLVELQHGRILLAELVCGKPFFVKLLALFIVSVAVVLFRSGLLLLKRFRLELILTQLLFG